MCNGYIVNFSHPVVWDIVELLYNGNKWKFIFYTLSEP